MTTLRACPEQRLCRKADGSGGRLGLHDADELAAGAVKLELILFDEPNCMSGRAFETPAAVIAAADQDRFLKLVRTIDAQFRKGLLHETADGFGQLGVWHTSTKLNG